MASTVHPAWHNCNDYVRKLHGRNSQILLGINLDSPVEFVVCWAKTDTSGGTAIGIKMAKKFGIPYFNLVRELDRVSFFDFSGLSEDTLL